MKKLGKILINPEKLMKKEEMISLKGGVTCYCFDENNNVCATGTASTQEECDEMCEVAPTCQY